MSKENEAASVIFHNINSLTQKVHDLHVELAEADARLEEWIAAKEALEEAGIECKPITQEGDGGQ